tara:strand:+ start:453 stop:1610 length:1158 start_codon:yes stop_codon:yes gene_type:complete
MTKLNCKIIKGYIEGFYGQILSWQDRDRILIKLKKSKMNSYLYAPKEDAFHRKNWRLPYKSQWAKEFKHFSKNANINKIQILFGISPGLDFNFNNLNVINKKSDLFILFTKCKKILKMGANHIVLLLDDIPNDFRIKYSTNLTEGEAHAELANKLSKMLKQTIFIVPRVYSDELIFESKNYLKDFCYNINSNLTLFYCGKNIVEKNINEQSLKKITNLTSNKIVLWDNFYANDYCPRRLFVGPRKYPSYKINIMINPTGLIETDLIILEIVAKSIKNPSLKCWKNILVSNGVPKEFINLIKYFSTPNFTNKPNFKAVNYLEQDLKKLNVLLWQWNSKISIEWHPYLLGLKQDLQLCLGILSDERIIKTQTNPLANLLLKHKEKKK